FPGLIFFDDDLAFAFEHPTHAADFAQVPAVLGEHMTDLADRPVAIVSGHVHQNRCAAGAVAFERDFVNLAAFQFASAAHDGALDIIGGDAGGLRIGDGFAKTRVHIGVAAAGTGSDHNLFDNAGKCFSALRVGGGLFV